HGGSEAVSLADFERSRIRASMASVKNCFSVRPCAAAKLLARRKTGSGISMVVFTLPIFPYLWSASTYRCRPLKQKRRLVSKPPFCKYFFAVPPQLYSPFPTIYFNRSATRQL